MNVHKVGLEWFEKLVVIREVCCASSGVFEVNIGFYEAAMHVVFLGEADGSTAKPLEMGSEIEVLAFDLLGSGL